MKGSSRVRIPNLLTSINGIERSICRNTVRVDISRMIRAWKIWQKVLAWDSNIPSDWLVPRENEWVSKVEEQYMYKDETSELPYTTLVGKLLETKSFYWSLLVLELLLLPLFLRPPPLLFYWWRPHYSYCVHYYCSNCRSHSLTTNRFSLEDWSFIRCS